MHIQNWCFNGQDIIHCHDWSSAPVAWLFKDHYVHYGLSKARVVFTIHNLEFGAQFIGKAVASSDKATTVRTYNSFDYLISRHGTFFVLYFLPVGLCPFDQVSHTYSKEVAGNPAVASHLYKFYGILNGIDPDIWDPYNDKFIPVSR